VSLGLKIFLVAMVAAGYGLAPVMLIWGWIRWFWRRRELGSPFFLAFVGFTLSTASAILAASAIMYAVMIRGFPFYDPTLLRIYGWGLLLSAAGMILGLTGVTRPNALRWQSPLAGLGMLAFWLMAVASE